MRSIIIHDQDGESTVSESRPSASKFFNECISKRSIENVFVNLPIALRIDCHFFVRDSVSCEILNIGFSGNNDQWSEI
jgi:hypothetical protein